MNRFYKVLLSLISVPFLLCILLCIALMVVILPMVVLFFPNILNIKECENLSIDIDGLM